MDFLRLNLFWTDSKEDGMDSETNMGKNMGFVFNSRLFDLSVTCISAVIGALGVLSHHDGLVAFCVPAAIGLFRQAYPLLTFVYVMSVGIAVVLSVIYIDQMPRVMRVLGV